MVDQNANGYTSDIYGNIIGDPLFLDRVEHDYNITSGSPAINAGLANN